MRDVWVDGRRVVKERALTTVKLDALIEEAQEIVRRRREAIPAEANAAIEAQYPAFRQMILDTLKRGFGVERRISLN